MSLIAIYGRHVGGMYHTLLLFFILQRYQY